MTRRIPLVQVVEGDQRPGLAPVLRLAGQGCLPRGAPPARHDPGSAGGRHVVLRDEDDPIAEATAGEVPLSVGDVLERHLRDG